jgi:predicted transcriptional regulator of viral defense system
LSALPKPYFTTADLERIIGLTGKSLAVTLGRLVKDNVLLRVRRNMYVVAGTAIDVERIGMALRYPSYLSFESALSRHGILSQIPHTVTFATTRPSGHETIATIHVEYSHLPTALFWGYKNENGLQVAEPEKALLDQLYMVAKGNRSLVIDELDLHSINHKTFNEYASRFLPFTGQRFRECIKRIEARTHVLVSNSKS